MATIRLFRHYLRVPFVLLAMSEALILGLSVYLATYVRFLGDSADYQYSGWMLLAHAAVFAFVMTTSMVAMGLYHGRLRYNMTAIITRVIGAALLGSVALALLFYVLPALYLGRGVLALAMSVAIVGIAVVRTMFFLTVDETALKRRVLVLGAGRETSDFLKLRRRSDRRGFYTVGFIPVEGEKQVQSSDKMVTVNGALADFATEREVDEIVVAVEDRRKNLPVADLLECKFRGIDVIDVLTFFERESGKVMLDRLHPSWMIFSDGFSQGFAFNYAKRIFDVTTSIVLLAVTWPIMLVAAFAVSAESRFRYPILYRQTRVGINGRPFTLLKFRSMRVDAEQDGRARWAEKRDSRITRTGAIIRTLRIDELPQIYNVLRGDMSFVGPRPERPEFVAELAKKFPGYMDRHRVKPGITGWAQLNYPYGSSDKDAMEKLQFDLYYVKNQSLLLDFLILLQTAEVVLFGKGAR